MARAIIDGEVRDDKKIRNKSTTCKINIFWECMHLNITYLVPPKGFRKFIVKCINGYYVWYLSSINYFFNISIKVRPHPYSDFPRTKPFGHQNQRRDWMNVFFTLSKINEAIAWRKRQNCIFWYDFCMLHLLSVIFKKE